LPDDASVLVVEGRPLSKIKENVGVACVLWVALCGAALLLFVLGGGAVTELPVVAASAAAVGIPGLVAPIVFASLARRRAGFVAFGAEKIVLNRPWRRADGTLVETKRELPWASVRGVRVDERAIELVTAQASAFYVVPALDEATRRSVLELLEKRGVPRIEAHEVGRVLELLDSRLEDDPSVGDPEKALLVVRGHGRGLVRRARAFGILVGMGGLLGSYYAAQAGLFPDKVGAPIVAAAAFLRSLGNLRFWVLAIPVGLVALAAELLVRGRTGTVAFHEDRIELGKPRRKSWAEAEAQDVRVSLPWSKIRGYRDGDADSIQLVATSGSSDSLHTIPTIREADRVAVLKLLDERRVPRLED
jgi:hypothetical protein